MSVTKETPREHPSQTKVPDHPSANPEPELPEIPQWRRLQTRSSTIFSKTMSDFEVKMQERLRKQHEAMLARQRQEQLAGPVALTPIADDLEEDEEDDMDDPNDGDNDKVLEKVDPHKEQLKKSAKRAWGLIKRYINEQRMKNKNQKSGMNWSFLKNTLSQMTNMEKAREDLYKKYLYAENPNEWTKGLTHVPEHLFHKQKGRKEDKKTPRPELPAAAKRSSRKPLGKQNSKSRST